MHIDIERPVGIAAGLIKAAGHIPEGLEHIAEHITFGSFTQLPQEGGIKGFEYYFDEVTQGSISVIDLTNQGLEAFLDEVRKDLKFYQDLTRAGCKLRLSLAPLKTGDLEEMGKVLKENWDIVSILFFEIEINAAYPNHRDATSGMLCDVLAHNRVALQSLMKQGHDYLPQIQKAVKIAPDTKEVVLKSLVMYAMKFGFATIVNHNMRRVRAEIDGNQVLSVEYGGQGGLPILDSAVAQGHLLARLINESTHTGTKPRLIGCGGIMSVDGARKHLVVPGVKVIQVATYFERFGIDGIRDLVAELV